MQLKREIYIQYENVPVVRECLNVSTVDLETILFFITDISILFAIINFISLWYVSVYVYRNHCQVKPVNNIYSWSKA